LEKTDVNESTGFVRLDACMADDLSVVNSARVSFGRQSTELTDADVGLIKFLMRERHGTPFEHNAFRFHIKCPIFVAREWFRHRIGSFNEFSGRYAEIPSEFWVPEPDDVRTQVGKPGAYTFEPMSQITSEEAADMIEEACRNSFRVYHELLELNVAKEIARAVIPVASFTKFYWTVNARSLMNFLSLRTAETAQLEIRKYALEVEEHFKESMPVTYEAWNTSGKPSV
jgi:thymidylate synthase (FAD)